MTNYYEGKLFRTEDGKFYTNDLDGAGFTEVAPAVAPAYKVYRALLTQEGTNDPTANVLENTLGGLPILSRTSSGNYLLTLSSAFPTDKTIVFASIITGDSIAVIFTGPQLGDTVRISTYTGPQGSADPADDWQIALEIRVYP